MFDNIGHKIKIVARVFFMLGVVISIFASAGYCMALEITDNFLLYIIFAILGGISSWVVSILIYGFGELIESVTKISKNIDNHNNE